jgi:hypothetical protein
MTAPVLAVGDGALGFWKAVREVFPATREQRCWFHKQANVLAALPKSAHPGALATIKTMNNAEDIDKAQTAIKAFEIDYGAKYLKAVAKIADDAAVLLVFLQESGRAPDPPENDKSDRKHLCDRAVADQGHQGTRMPPRRNCHGLQADPRRTSPLASGQRTTPGRPGPSPRGVPQRQLLERLTDITPPANPAEPGESTGTEDAHTPQSVDRDNSSPQAGAGAGQGRWRVRALCTASNPGTSAAMCTAAERNNSLSHWCARSSALKGCHQNA